MLWLILLMGLLVAVLIYWEYADHDCLPHKACNKRVCRPSSNDNPLETIDKIKIMVRNNYDYVSWRLALLAGIIAALPIVYYLECRVPTLFEWIVVGVIIFAATYLSNSWIWAHFFHPNGSDIEKHLVKLRDKVHTLLESERGHFGSMSSNSSSSYLTNSNSRYHSSYSDYY